MRALLQSGIRPREERVTVVIPSRLRVGTQWIDAVIHNVSSRGMMVACDLSPSTGSYVELRRGTIVIVGRVMWTKNRFFGLRAQDRLSVKALVDEPRLASRPRRPDEPSAEDRRRDDRLQAEARLARGVERSRAFASAFQYGMAAAVVMTMAGIGGSLVYEALSAPVQVVTQTLATANASVRP